MSKNQVPLIQTNKLKKYFALKRSSIFQRRPLYVRANEDVSITIFKGETFGLVGESGCGKTTLGRVILQLYPATSGSAIYYGVPLKELNPEYVIKEIKQLPKYQARAIKAYNKTIAIDEKYEALKAQMFTNNETVNKDGVAAQKADIQQQMADIETSIKEIKNNVINNLNDIIVKIVDLEAGQKVDQSAKIMMEKAPLEEVINILGDDKRFAMLIGTYENYLKIFNDKDIPNYKEKEQRALVVLNNNIERTKERVVNNILKHRILAVIKTVKEGEAETITHSIIKKFPHSDPKLYQPLFGLYKKHKNLNEKLKIVGRDLKNEAALKKLEVKSKELKKEASRQLREGSRTAGALILEKDIKLISELMLKAELAHRANFSLKKDIKRLVTLKDKTEQQKQDLNTKLDTSAKLEVEIKKLNAEVDSFKGKQPMAITERTLDPEYAEKMEANKEFGINLGRLTKEEMRNLRKRLQIIFQDPYSSLNPRLTVGQAIEEAVVEHGLFKRKSPELEAYVVDIMAKCGLDHYMIHRYAHQFSGGQRQRIGIARALALMPEFVVCDESVSALDVSIRSQVLNLLSDLKRERDLTYLFISHDLSVIKHISDRIGVMYLGNLVELCDSEELYRNPLHPYSKALISAIPTTDNDPNKPKRIILEGDIPSNIFPPSGCKFRTRCPLATSLCAKKVPEYREVEPNHFVACHYYEKTKDLK